MKKLMMMPALAVALALQAKVDLATPFTDGMVLQRELPVRVWGTADAGEKVTVSFAGQKVSATADAHGKWLVSLAPLTASKESRALIATGAKAGDAVEVKDVLVGEVWMCSGQSNAEYPIWSPHPRSRDGNGAMMLQKTMRPYVRLVRTPRAYGPTPQSGYKAKWMKMTPDMYDAFKKGTPMPSAIAYYFALELYNAIDVPIGIVSSSIGGTNIDSWIPTSGFATRPDLKDVLDYKTTAKKEDWTAACRKGPINGYEQQPSFLWNGMVAAYVPMTMRGFIWYQGCHNGNEAHRYSSKMHALYNGWSKEFQNPDLKLYFAQLAPWGGHFFPLRLAQAQFDKEQKNAGMAVLSDLGNRWDIHPNQKYLVGARLAVHALRRDYGFTKLRDNSPTLKSWKVEGDKFILSFDDVDSWYVYKPDRTLDTGFEIAGADGKFVPATVQNHLIFRGRACEPIEGKDLIVSAPGVTEPKRLRYLATAPCEGFIYNESCLPLGPFKID